MYVSLNPHESHDEGHIISGCPVVTSSSTHLETKFFFTHSELFFALIKMPADADLFTSTDFMDRLN